MAAIYRHHKKRKHGKDHGYSIGKMVSSRQFRADIQSFKFKDKLILNYETACDATLRTRVVGNLLPWNCCFASGANPNLCTVFNDRTLGYGSTIANTTVSQVRTGLLGMAEVLRNQANNAAFQGLYGVCWVPRMTVKYSLRIVQAPSGGASLIMAPFMVPTNPYQAIGGLTQLGATYDGMDFGVDIARGLAAPGTPNADSQFNQLKQWSHMRYKEVLMSDYVESGAKVVLKGTYDTRRFLGPRFPHEIPPFTAAIVSGGAAALPSYYTDLTTASVTPAYPVFQYAAGPPVKYSTNCGLYWGFWISTASIDAVGDAGTVRFEIELEATATIEAIYPSPPNIAWA